MIDSLVDDASREFPEFDKAGGEIEALPATVGEGSRRSVDGGESDCVRGDEDGDGSGDGYA